MTDSAITLSFPALVALLVATYVFTLTFTSRLKALIEAVTKALEYRADRRKKVGQNRRARLARRVDQRCQILDTAHRWMTVIRFRWLADVLDGEAAAYRERWYEVKRMDTAGFEPRW